MPTSKIKNILYRFALPLAAPGPDANCLLSTAGGHLIHENVYRKIIRKHHVLGSVLLLSDGAQSVTVYSRSLRPEHNPLISPVFRVASITKMATALMALICVQKHLIDLDVPVQSVMPREFRDSEELNGVTLRHLLSHTAGLKDPPDMEQSLLAHRSVLDVLKGCRVSKPGEIFRYSNLGFGLIGCVIEELLQESVISAFDHYLFRPLGSRATLNPNLIREEQIMPVTRVLPYHHGCDIRITALGREQFKSPDPFLHYGHTAGSMYTDIDSLRKLMQCLMKRGEPLISQELGLEMTKIHASYGKLSPTLSYGLGLLRINDSKLSDSSIWGHQGYAYGCADGAFWEEKTGRLMIFLNGGCSEARVGRLGLCNRDLLNFAFRKEIPSWISSQK